MDINNCGETSKKKSHDICDNERPLKKARYLWQVKGKYHLKDNIPKQESMVTEEIESNSTPETKNDNDLLTDNNNVSVTVNNNISIAVNNNVPQSRNKHRCNDRSCIEQLIATSDRIMDFRDPDSPPHNIDKSISDEIPITLVKPHPKNDDYYLHKWQARQIAKGFVDNTINRVLENWMVAPFDAADFVENCENGGQVEDEGILMAIQSHGLQSGIRENQNHQNNVPCRSRVSENECTCSQPRKQSSYTPIPFHSRVLVDDSMEYYENICVLKDSVPIDRNVVYNPSRNVLDLHSFKENDPTIHITENIQDLEIPSNNYEMSMDDTDFLDAAVSVAIKKKGLTSYNCVDYG